MGVPVAVIMVCIIDVWRSRVWKPMTRGIVVVVAITATKAGAEPCSDSRRSGCWSGCTTTNVGGGGATNPAPHSRRRRHRCRRRRGHHFVRHHAPLHHQRPLTSVGHTLSPLATPLKRIGTASASVQPAWETMARTRDGEDSKVIRVLDAPGLGAANSSAQPA